MTLDEAKVVLSVRRPDGSDDAGRLLAPALALARSDAGLGAWMGREAAFDRAVGAGLREVTPPAALREAILAGRGVRRGGGGGRVSWVWAMAASFALLLAPVGVGRVVWSGPTTDELVALALRDVASSAHAVENGPSEKGLAAVLADPGFRLGDGLPAPASDLAAQGCRRLTLGGREIFEVCFQRPGTGKNHLYITYLKDFKRENETREVEIFGKRGRSLAMWAKQGRLYVLVSDDDTRVIRNLL